MGDTTISWTDKSWNPTTGCTRVSTGCERCYAEALAFRRLQHISPRYKGTVTEKGKWTGRVNLQHDKVDEPRKWRKPYRIFVDSMSDLFHPEVPFDFIDQLFATMEETPHHTYQILTKRPGRALKWWRSSCYSNWTDAEGKNFFARDVPNIWIGTSVENQDAFGERWITLREIPFAIRFLSIEPLLGEIDMSQYLRVHNAPDHPVLAHRLSWVIVGGESGPDARPMKIEWARKVVEQCKTAGVAVFVKQLGGRYPGTKLEDLPEDLRIREYPKPDPERIDLGELW